MQMNLPAALPVRRVTPPGPRGLPGVGNLLTFMRDPLTMLHNSARTYGDVMQIRLGPKSLFYLNHPDLIEQVLVEKAQTFSRAVDFMPQQGFLNQIFGKGLATSDGELWRQQRRLMQPAFHRQRIAGYTTTMNNVIAQMLGDWTDGATFDLHQAMMRLTLQVATQTLFGATIATELPRIQQALEIIMCEMVARLAQPFRLPLSIATPRNHRVVQAIEYLDHLLLQLTSERRASGQDTGDLLSTLIHTTDEHGNYMPQQQLRDEIITLFIVGHDTTANALTWLWHLLSTHPTVTAHVRTELDSILQGRVPSMSDLPRLTYTNMVLKEAMRMYPATWMIGPRTPVQPCTLGGYHFKPGDILAVCPWIIHYDTRFWSNPQRFDPERWTEARSNVLHRYAYIPFGAGQRMCIGHAFAQTEIALVLAQTLQQFSITSLPNQRLIAQASLSVRPKHGLLATVTRRTS